MKYIFAALAALTLTGCSGATAQCNDSEVKRTVMEIILSRVDGWGGKGTRDSVVDGNISQVRTTSRDEELDSYMCEANFVFSIKGKPYTKPVQYDLSYLEDEKDTSVSVDGADQAALGIIGLISSAD